MEQTYETLTKCMGYVAKLNMDDRSRTESVTQHYSKHIDPERLFEAAGLS